MRSIFLLLSFSPILISYGQKLQAYQLFNKEGKKVDFEKMVSTLSEKDVILFGELHNDPISHWMQLELTKKMHEKGNIAMGGEMFEQDNQNAVNSYLSGALDDEGLDTVARLWTNYKTDYKPLLDYAKDNVINFIATNIPRRYASMVYKNGFEILDSLPKKEKEWIAPLPIPYDPELPGYKAMQTMMSDHANENFPKAQAIKDATMAHFIYQRFKRDNAMFIHYNGAYHSNNFEGIYWYLKQLQESLRIGTITTVLQENVNTLEKDNAAVADFILVVDEDMTTTY
ncbi:MAG: iron-regulated protein [Fluviicola sp.]|nr:MAG: iron-regulated protein [Fluviicola sp.]